MKPSVTTGLAAVVVPERVMVPRTVAHQFCAKIVAEAVPAVTPVPLESVRESPFEATAATVVPVGTFGLENKLPTSAWVKIPPLGALTVALAAVVVARNPGAFVPPRIQPLPVLSSMEH